MIKAQKYQVRQTNHTHHRPCIISAMCCSQLDSAPAESCADKPYVRIRRIKSWNGCWYDTCMPCLLWLVDNCKMETVTWIVETISENQILDCISIIQGFLIHYHPAKSGNQRLRVDIDRMVGYCGSAPSRWQDCADARYLWNQQDTSDQCTVPLVDSGTFIFDYMFHQKERLEERRLKNLSAFVYVYQPLTNSTQSRVV
jgi:hypothetical protein